MYRRFSIWVSKSTTRKRLDYKGARGLWYKTYKNFISKFLFRHKKLKKIIANKDYDSETIENYSSYLFSAIKNVECKRLI